MANITINEVSQNYTYNIGNNSYATVALPMTACWGPGFEDAQATGIADDSALESVVWSRFPATQAGLESFVSTFRGPSNNYMLHQDYSYQIAMTLLTSGYDLLVCRVATGQTAQGKFKLGTGTEAQEGDQELSIKAKYLGSFGNNLVVSLRKLTRLSGSTSIPYWNAVVYIQAASGVKTAVENINFVFDINNSSDSILHIGEIESNFIQFSNISFDSDDLNLRDADATTKIATITLIGGSDLPEYPKSESESDPTISDILQKAINLATSRFGLALHNDADYTFKDENESLPKYINGGKTSLSAVQNGAGTSLARANSIWFREWMFTAGYTVLGSLSDKLAYNPNRIIVPGWDDQDYRYLANDDSTVVDMDELSPLHIRLMDIAFSGRCATAYIDIPRSISRSRIYNESLNTSTEGYAQKLARHVSTYSIESGSIYASHSALFAPWGKYAYVGSTRQGIASPSFLALMIDRAMIKNQTSQYEWELPTNRKHNLKIGKLDYTISKKYLDKWQSLEGVGINCITAIPDLGISIWGNSTLYEVPPATYQALANLSTRKLVNAVEDLAYRCGISITFQYNNEQAYNAFYAGMTPLLDTMRNLGAIEDYYLRMAEDVNGLDQVNANSVIGKIYLVVDGVINDINIDLICLPPQTSLDDYKA